MSDWKEGVHEELADMVSKMIKLRAFDATSLNPRHQALLRQQLRYMELYARTLGERLAADED